MFFKDKFKKTGFQYIIAGLGNPGLEYRDTKHNVGFMALDKIAENHGCEPYRHKFNSLVSQAEISGCKCLLLKPETYMNLSGEAVSEAMRFYKILPERVIVIFDDISLPPGRIRIRRKGSDGGHNGIKNIIECTGSDMFPRIKVGVGAKPRPDYDLKDWVLSGFSDDALLKVQTALDAAVEAVDVIINDGIDTAMCRFNGA